MKKKTLTRGLVVGQCHGEEGKHTTPPPPPPPLRNTQNDGIPPPPGNTREMGHEARHVNMRVYGPHTDEELVCCDVCSGLLREAPCATFTGASTLTLKSCTCSTGH